MVEEDEPSRNIETVGEGLWWAVTTVTTVGYGDTFPTSPLGKGIAVVLMLVGVGLFGLLAASLASFLIDRERSDEPDEPSPGLREILERLERIERRLEASHSDPAEEGREGREP